MDLEELTQKLDAMMPRPVLVALVLFGAIVLFLLFNPPRTICDTQKENLRENYKGVLFPLKAGKYSYPGKIQEARESCRLGDSSGACYEYLSILRKVAHSIKNGSTECFPDMVSITIEKYQRTETYETVVENKVARDEVLGVNYTNARLDKVLSDAVELMVLKAWGEKPPEPGLARFGWLQEFEMGVFCHLQDILRRAKGDSGWAQLRTQIIKKLPGEEAQKLPEGVRIDASMIPPRKLAVHMYPEQQIMERSLFSVPCNRFR